MSEAIPSLPLGKRFRGFYPVIVDVETGGFNPKTDALLQVAIVLPQKQADGSLIAAETHSWHVQPFEGANLEPASLEVNGIDPYHPLRIAHQEKHALAEAFRIIRAAVKDNQCTRAILVGHNAAFDHNFINAAAERCNLKRNPFHPFSHFDTVSLSALAYGQTVLARGVKAAGISWDNSEAHSATYDAEKTAELFCTIVNRWQALAGPIGEEAPQQDDPEPEDHSTTHQ